METQEQLAPINALSLLNFDGLDNMWSDIETKPKQTPLDMWKERALKAEEKLAWISLCAEDVITLFPKFTLRTIATMGKSIETLKEAIQ